MKRYYYYQVHNFRLRSTMPFPELWPIPPQQTEVTLLEGNPPRHLKKPQKQGQAFNGFHTYEYKPGEFLLEIKDVGRCLIRKGKQITIQKKSDVPDDQFRMYFLTSGIGYLLLLRGCFALHASAVDLGDECILFTGECGAGKSTTAAQFLRAGYNLLSDDVCVLNKDEKGRVIAYPSMPVIKLWRDSANWMKFNVDEKNRILPDYNKYQVSMAANFTTLPKPVRTIYVLQPSENAQTKIRQLRGFEKINALFGNIYRKVGVEIFGYFSIHFEFCTQMAQSINELKKISYPESSLDNFSLVDLVQKDLALLLKQE